jgi:hypothetical protein
MQPLSRVKPKAVMMAFGQDRTMAGRPKVAVLMAECIAKWADIETMLGILLTLLLDTDAKATLAMYSALESRAPQLRMLEAAAESKLSEEHFDLFAVLLLQHLKPAMRERDKLAHWCWGYSPELPEALLLLEPDEKTIMHMDALDPPAPAKIDRSKVFVVTESDLTRTINRLLTVTNRVAAFMGTVWKRNSSDQRAALLQKLSTEPEIEKALVRRRESREKPPSAPPILPEEWHSGTP